MKFITYCLVLVALAVPMIALETNANADQTPETANTSTGLRTNTGSPMRRLFFWWYYSKPQIYGLELYDTYSNVKLQDVYDGCKIDLNLYKKLGIFSLNRLNIRAKTSSYTQSIKYDWNSILLRISSSLADKFSVCGIDNYKSSTFGSCLGCKDLSFLKFGRNCIKATPYNSVFALGSYGDSFNACFDVISGGPSPVPAPVKPPTKVWAPVPIPYKVPEPVKTYGKDNKNKPEKKQSDDSED
jgi:hypothetical protein